MESHAKALGHAIHQQLIPFPLGLLSTAVVFDLLRLVTDDDRYATAAFFMVAAGVITALTAAVFGLIDYYAIPRTTRAKRVGTVHGLGNVVVVVLFAIAWLLRRDDAARVADGLALVVELAGVALLTVTGWLGGELVGRLAVGIDAEAGLDTPASFETTVRVARAGAATPAL
ncbi:MAG: DUF2231 domain-containing protein [Mycobacteriales bacterium]|nr:DUF2231 domain-containing protein [Frankia sp.]